jgi:hypothetical protein
MQHCKGERCVSPGAYLKVQIGRCGGLGPHRIDDDDFSIVFT